MAETDKIKYSTDYHLEELFLISSGVANLIDLKPLLVEMNYFEDIFSNTISGRLFISDAVGVLNMSSMHGTEFIKFKFRKHKEMEPIERTFRVYSVSNREHDKGQHFESYNIDFCSEELMLSEQYRISKGYKGKSIKSIIDDVLENFLLVNKSFNKKCFIEETKGIYDFVLPNKKLFETINWLSTYAQPKSGKTGGDMLFFENGKGYNFASLQTLYEIQEEFIYHFDPKNVRLSDDISNKTTSDKSLGRNIFNVLHFEILNSFDCLDAVTKGIFSNKITSFDPITRRKFNYYFDYVKNHFEPSKKLNDHKVINDYKNRYGKTLYDEPPDNPVLETGTYRVVVTNKDQNAEQFLTGKQEYLKKDLFINQYMPFRVCQLSLANYNKLKLTVPGNSDLMAGRSLQFNAFGTQHVNTKEKEKEPDPYISGKYLISAVRHTFTPAKYISIIEAIKESHEEEYANVKDDELWKALVKGVQNP
jgi:hypothetical protein